MKHFGKPYNKKVVTKQYHDLEYITCDKCKKTILPCTMRRDENSRYVKVHTWHGDWGYESAESHEYMDLCPVCAPEYVSKYISEMRGTEELELENGYLWKETEEISKDDAGD